MNMIGMGVLEAGGKEYLLVKGKLPDLPVEYNVVRSELTNTVLCARIFRADEEKDGVISGTDIFMNPRWITVSGNFVINWFPEPLDVEVTDAWKTPVFSWKDVE